jgi:hypothetical protein
LIDGSVVRGERVDGGMDGGSRFIVDVRILESETGLEDAGIIRGERIDERIHVRVCVVEHVCALKTERHKEHAKERCGCEEGSELPDKVLLHRDTGNGNKKKRGWKGRITASSWSQL